MGSTCFGLLFLARFGVRVEARGAAFRMRQEGAPGPPEYIPKQKVCKPAFWVLWRSGQCGRPSVVCHGSRREWNPTTEGATLRLQALSRAELWEPSFGTWGLRFGLGPRGSSSLSIQESGPNDHRYYGFWTLVP